MKRERSEDEDEDARAPGSPPRGLEREKKIQKFSFWESPSCTTTTTRHGKRSLSQKLITFYYDFRTIQTTIQTTEEEEEEEEENDRRRLLARDDLYAS